MIRTLAISHDHQVTVGQPLEQIVMEDYIWIWADFNEPTESESELLTSYFHFHPLAVEDCMHVLQRPKLDYYEDVQFLVVHALDADTLEAEEVDMFIGSRFLVTYHHREQEELDQAWERIVEHANERKIWSRGPLAAAYTVMDKLVDNYFPSLFIIEDELAELEGLGAHESVEELMKQVFDLRGRLLKLRRTIVPMRDLMYRVLNSQHVQGQGDHKAYFTDIYDHLLKLTDMLEADREMTADLRDSYISLNSNRMNSIMKTLTVITTIFMPLTLIAGIYGMNFSNMPELGWKYGYFGVLFFMFLLSVAMVVWFIRRGWFK
ncbi:metal transporter [Paenibacillus jamilae]|uniref:Metal transporter n=1 Tax=Paenibacillus jamilae TaxID=114136 RepID=A0ACC4ZZV8_9BACL|nr:MULTISPECIES: magnesium/cobalt transporter CorA [Paenibacillus]AUO05697.1 magnesium and cobalt transport protein CorA [Paenibacillus sp. lzh-N1]KTS83937.1 metal transporter [Paenibacillus jamilae]